MVTPQETSLQKGEPDKAIHCLHTYLCVEILFIQIRENEEAKGIRIGDNEIKLSAYADDEDFLTSDVSSLETIFQICATLQLYSSLKLNLEKSEACWIGNRMGSNERPINCRWVDIKCSVIRTLGIFNSYHKDLEQKLNFLDNIKTLNDVLKLWEFRASHLLVEFWFSNH